MGQYQIVIPHVFHSLNEFIDANRGVKSGRYSGNNMKQEDQAIIRAYLPRIRVKRPVYIQYTYYERNKRRDMDNISGYFHKIFQDALVAAGVIPDDGWQWIKGFSDEFRVDQQWSRVEVIITEVGKK